MSQKNLQDHQQPFKSTHRFINLLFQNRQLKPTTFAKTILIFLILAIIFIGISIFFFIEMSQVIQFRQQYYDAQNPGSNDIGTTYNVTIKITQSMKAPIYFMYQLDNFYQNHRRYIQSKSNKQLAGNEITLDQASICDPYVTNADFHVNQSWNKVALDPNAVASPCGSIARTFFNDSFQLFDIKQNAITINEKGITWPGDQGFKYARTSNSESTQWVDPQNQHFIVWMRTSGLPNFKKLWGKIQSDMAAGTYTLRIYNNYDSKDWNGNRYIILTTVGLLGGKNYLLPIAFLLVGVFCLIMDIIFFWRSRKLMKRN